MKERHLDLVRMVCDHQLLDANYVECSKVEDLELEGGPGELKVVALLTGPGAAADRLPAWMAKFAKKLFGDQIRRVPWREVHVITSRIKLKSKASNLQLADDRIVQWLKNLPNAE